MKIHKKCTTIMLAIILSMQTIPVLASSNTGQSGTTARVTTSGVEDLTLSQATRRAADNSSVIRNTQDSITLSRDHEQQLRDQLFSTNDINSILELSARLMESELQRALNLDSIDAQRDTLAYLVTGHFINIAMAEKALEAYDAEIAILEREVEIAKVKVELGLVSQVDYELALINLEREKNKRTGLVNSINEAYRTLNRIMGAPLDRRYNLIFDLEYDELGEVDITTHINNHRRNSVQVQRAQNKLNVAQFQLDNHMTPINMETGEILPGATRDDRITSVNSAAREVREAREGAEDSLLKTYDEIRKTEINIQSLLLQLESLQRELEILNTQLSIGNATLLEIDKKKLQIIQHEQNIMQQQLNHSLLIMKFNNPNISA